MDSRTSTRLAQSAAFLITALAVFMFATPASAQDELDPEQGGVWVPPPDDTPPEPPPPVEEPPPVHTQDDPNQSPAWYQGGPTGTTNPPAEESPPGMGTSTSNPDSPPSDGTPGESDHAAVVGHLAVGFMGASVLPIGGATLGDPNQPLDTVTAPAIGIRYWFDPLAGIDIGLGFGFTGGATETNRMSAPDDNAFAFLLHAGVPIAVFHQEHYKFLIIPEINLGFTSGTDYGGLPDEDRSLDGVLFQIGGRLGTEIHFGFMDIPQLSLQASVGIYFSYVTRSIGNNLAATSQSVAVQSYEFATSVQGEPWDIVLGMLNAMYYF